MCGRFTLHLAELGDLRALLGVQRVLIAEWQPRYNIAPGQLAPVVVGGDERTLLPLRWGMVTGTGPSADRVQTRINARVENVARAPMFRDAFRTHRCIVPATGFFEWRAETGPRKKQPFWIRPADGGPLALAGVWSSSVSRDGEVIDSFVILTTDAHGVVRGIHDRMPLSLHGADVERWLGAGVFPTDALQQLVRRSADSAEQQLAAHAVDRRVNSSAQDDPECIAPAAEPTERQLDMFGDGASEALRMDGEDEK
jgi:putative SOS response-associated peptidase YedK